MADQIYPEPTVGVFIFNNEGKVLLLRSHKWPDGYTIPGGHIELGEHIEQAAQREALEETGLVIRDLHLLCFQEFVYDPSFWKPRHFIFFDYACQTDSTKVRLNDEAESYFWIEPEKALDLALDHYTRVSVLKYLEFIGKGDSHN